MGQFTIPSPYPFLSEGAGAFASTSFSSRFVLVRLGVSSAENLRSLIKIVRKGQPLPKEIAAVPDKIDTAASQLQVQIKLLDDYREGLRLGRLRGGRVLVGHGYLGLARSQCLEFRVLSRRWRGVSGKTVMIPKRIHPKD